MTPTLGTIVFYAASLALCSVLLTATTTGSPSECVAARVSRCADEGYHTDTEVEFCEQLAVQYCGR